MSLAYGICGQPVAGGGGSPRDKVEQWKMPPKHPMLAMGDERVEHPVAREQLARDFSSPTARSPSPASVAGRQCPAARRPASTGNPTGRHAPGTGGSAARTHKDGGCCSAGIFHATHASGQMADRVAAMSEREPDPVAQPKARVAIHRQAEWAAQQFAFHQLAQGRALALHGVTFAPRYQGSPALMRWPPTRKGTGSCASPVRCASGPPLADWPACRAACRRD